MRNSPAREAFPLKPAAAFNRKAAVSPFRYPGGKFYGLRYLLPFVNCVPHDEYREPFVGGGAVFFAKPTVRFNWLNDLDEDLMTAYRAIADPNLRPRLKSLLSKEVASKERHAEVKQMVAGDPLQVAFKTYYLNRTSYSGILNKPAWGYKAGQSAPPETWGTKIEVAGRKLEGTKLGAWDFEDVVGHPAEGERVLMYLDPPYFSSDQKRAYANPFSSQDHMRLERALRDTEFYFCLSYDDTPETRDMYSWAYIHERSWLYNTADKRGAPRKAGRELIITNYRVRTQRQQTLSGRAA